MYKRALQIYLIIKEDHMYLHFNAFISNTLRELLCRSSRCVKSFLHNVVASWEVMIKHFKIMPSIGKHLISFFRSNIKSTLSYDLVKSTVPKPEWFLLSNISFLFSFYFVVNF